MQISTTTLRRAAACAMLTVASTLAACGGGGGGSSPVPSAPGTSAPTATPTQAAQDYQSQVTGVASVSGGTLTVNATAPVVSTASTTSPTGVALRKRASEANQSSLLYVTIAAQSGSASVTEISGNITFTTPPSQTVSLSVWSASAQQWVAQNATIGVNGSTVTFDAALSPGLATPVYVALYEGTPLPSPSPSPSASPVATASPSNAPSTAPSPSASPTGSPAPSATTAPNSCSQTPQPGTQTGSITNQASSFLNAVQTAQQVCLSVWEPSSQVQNALVTAAQNHAAVTVIYPIEEYSYDKSNANALSGLGARIIWANDTGSTQTLPYGQSLVTSALPIHAKFALVNGIAYLDGHNWFSSDVILQDGVSGDYTAIQSDLTSLPASPPTNGSFTTDKYLSLQNEAAMIAAANPGAGQTVQFISEDFSDYGPSADAPAVYGALTAAATNGATVDVIVEGPASGFNSYETCDLQTLAWNGAHVYIGSSGSEKITLIGPTGGTPATGWIGSSNMSNYDFIDWGMTVTNASLITAISSYYGSALSSATPYPAPTSAPSCSL